MKNEKCVQAKYRPGGEGGNRPLKAKPTAQRGHGQFWGADFENWCYKAFWAAFSLVFTLKVSLSIKVAILLLNPV